MIFDPKLHYNFVENLFYALFENCLPNYDIAITIGPGLKLNYYSKSDELSSDILHETDFIHLIKKGIC